LTCAEASRFRDYELIVVQIGGPAGVAPADLAGCVQGMSEIERIPIELSVLLPGVRELAVFRTQQ
jgi:hypothetical protein